MTEEIFFDLTKGTPKDTPESVIERDPLDEYGGLWQELYFFKDGTTKLETDLWETEEAAQKQINSMLEDDPSKELLVFNDGTEVLVENIYHAVPMPILGEE